MLHDNMVFAEKNMTPESIARWHEKQGMNAINSLSCGSENSDYRRANRVYDAHKRAADIVRSLWSTAAMLGMEY